MVETALRCSVLVLLSVTDEMKDVFAVHKKSTPEVVAACVIFLICFLQGPLGECQKAVAIWLE
jgi:hypothetical protein